jgi:arsenite-transporting ATPase
VARAQASSLREVARTREELATIGFTQQSLVINGILPEAEAAHDAIAAALWKREQAALAAMPETLQTLPTDRVALKPFNLVGVDALRGLLSDAAVVVEATEARAPASSLPSLADLIDGLADDGHGLIMLMGKGGVGKTTLAAAIAVDLAGRGYPVHLTTSDPAAHLVETLDGSLDRLTVSRIDPHAETERYRQHVLATKGRDLDEPGRALLEEDLRSPCTEEIAVFQAFSRVIREAGRKFVVMDTAPTGHALLLLDATGAYHREIARQVGGSGLHFTTPVVF